MKRIPLFLIIVLLLASIAASAQVKVSTAPAIPGQRSATLTWTESTPGVTFNVYRGSTAGGENATPLGTVGVGVLTYVDTTVVSGATYYYTVTALSTIESEPSNEVVAVVPIAPASPSLNPAIVQ
jgi:fibronectin type 3 domain-containing protein